MEQARLRKWGAGLKKVPGASGETIMVRGSANN